MNRSSNNIEVYKLLVERREKWKALFERFNGYKISVDAYCEALDRIAESCDASDESLPEGVRSEYEKYVKSVTGLQGGLKAAYEKYAIVRVKAARDLRNGDREAKRRVRIALTKASNFLNEKVAALGFSQEAICELISDIYINSYIPCKLFMDSVGGRGDLPLDQADFLAAQDVEKRRAWEEDFGVPVQMFLKDFDQIHRDALRCQEIKKEIRAWYERRVKSWAVGYGRNKDYHGCWITEAECEKIGLETLGRAIEGFNPSRQKSFYKYLRSSVNREMWDLQREVRAKDAGLSVNMVRNIDKMKGIRNKVMAHSGPLEPCEEDKVLARLMSADSFQIKMLKKIEGLMGKVSFRELEEDKKSVRAKERAVPFESMIPDFDTEGDCVSEEVLEKHMAEILGCFSDKEREIVKCRFRKKRCASPYELADAKHVPYEKVGEIFRRMGELTRKWCKLDAGLVKFACRSVSGTLFLPGLSNGKGIDNWLTLFKVVCERAGKCHARELHALASKKNAVWIDLQPQDGFVPVSCSEGGPVFVSPEGETNVALLQHVVEVAEACEMTEAVLVFASGAKARQIFKALPTAK